MAVPYRLYLEAVVRADPRTSLILRLAGEHGLRRGEIALINTERDLLQEDSGWILVVHGKGGKNRVLPLSDSVSHALRCLPTGPAFPGKINGHLSGRRVSELAKCYLPNPWSIHKLGHMFASRGWAFSRDLLTMQKLLGHASPVTTQMYVEVDVGYPRDVMGMVVTRSFDERTDLALRKSELRYRRLDLETISSQQATELIALLSTKLDLSISVRKMFAVA
ncbi:tyrosine-type recombinase/integrase [Leucobacter luti]|uniref:tyrosine-type recombinase/integrase n=1 Tax=Leucobacter luti TaxID=340320 RepID=UPI001FB35824|nr:site-specific integrase [Leucobacter luti]MCW2289002.1 integrase [Leucobacter luti]